VREVDLLERTLRMGDGSGGTIALKSPAHEIKTLALSPAR
jgi:hypothetical protein